MSFATMATCIKTEDIEAVKQGYEGLTYCQVQPTNGPYVVVWRLHEFITQSSYHHLAPAAAQKWGEAFYVGTDSVTSCLSYARYIQDQLVRSLYFFDYPDEDYAEWESQGSPEAWEAELRVPTAWAEGVKIPEGVDLFFGILKHYGCPPRPEAEPR